MSAPSTRPVDERVRIYGIRHHGPGSARSLVAALDAEPPDLVLVEGPPDAQDVLHFAIAAGMEPPVALLVHVADDTRRAVFYPFAVFSPEWQAIRWALTRGVDVRFMDLPQKHRLAATEPTGDAAPAPDADRGLREDPLRHLAEAAGYDDGERWWDHVVESRSDEDGSVFDAVLEAMTALREDLDLLDDPREARREAFMRKTLRAALREDVARVAVVCGAYHAPALARLPTARHDQDLLKGLPRVRTKAAWVPWTYGRLSFASGYGAGVESPEWYHLLWRGREAVATRWLTRVARLLREADLDASSASVIEAVRLAETLAALRGRALPDLSEMIEAVRTVLCFGDDGPLRLVREKLLVGVRLGRVADGVPLVPLQQDLMRLQKSLRLPSRAQEKIHDLDLRKPMDRDRSHLLHRLRILEVPWGERGDVSGKKGTFHEVWRLRWEPEFAVALIEACRWGSTVETAAAARAIDAAGGATDLSDLTEILGAALLADLPDAVTRLVDAIRARAAVAGNVPGLMDALPHLANVLRYGNVRETDTGMVAEVVDGLATRIRIGLPGACSSLDDEAAAAMAGRLVAVNAAVALLDPERHVAPWRRTLETLLVQHGIHGLVAGRCARLLHDAGAAGADATARRLELALSAAAGPAEAAAWIEGLLVQGGPILVHDTTLRLVLDRWVAGLGGERFVEVLPLLRRTFATFEPPERREIGRRLRSGAATAGRATTEPFDAETAAAALPLLVKLLGLEGPADREARDVE